jgi:hypothetical protein
MMSNELRLMENRSRFLRKKIADTRAGIEREATLFSKALEEGTNWGLGGREQAVETPQRDQSRFSSSNYHYGLFVQLGDEL